MGYDDGNFQQRNDRPQGQQGQQGNYGGNGYNRDNNSSGYGGGNRNNGYSPRGGGNGGNNWNNRGGGYGGKGRNQDNSPGELYKAYLGTGNDDTPPEVLERFKAIAKELEGQNFVARNGGMSVVDDLFRAETTKQETILPWRNFRDIDSKHYYSTPQAHDIAKQFHPVYDKMKDTVKGFLAKNARAVLGKDLKSQIMFLICYSADGAERASDVKATTGNIGHVISIADAMLIPIFNFANRDAEQRLRDFIRLSNNVVQQNNQQQGGYQQQAPQSHGEHYGNSQGSQGNNQGYHQQNPNQGNNQGYQYQSNPNQQSSANVGTGPDEFQL